MANLYVVGKAGGGKGFSEDWGFKKMIKNKTPTMTAANNASTVSIFHKIARGSLPVLA
jgi:hypothetical protein